MVWTRTLLSAFWRSVSGWSFAAGPLQPESFLDSVQFTPYVLPFLGSLALTVGVMLYGLNQGRKRGFDTVTLSFICMLGSGTIWTASRVLQLSTANIFFKEVMSATLYVGYGGAVVSLFCFALAYTGRESYVTRRTVVLLSVVPTIGFILATANIHTPLLFEVEQVSDSPTFINRQFLPLFVPILAYSYLVLLAGLYLLFKMAITSQHLYRWQSIAIVAGTVLPMTTGILFVTNSVPLLPEYIDPTPIAFAGLGTLYGYSIYRFQLLDVVPIGRETAWNEMDDAVVTLGPARRVVDCNAAARQLFDVGTEYAGMPATDFFGPVSEDLFETFESGRAVDSQLKTRLDGEDRHFSLSASPIGEDGNEQSQQGQVLVLREITSLKRREEESELLREVQSRVLRHNLRNELNAIRGNAELLVEVVDDEYDDRAADVIDASDKLLSISRKARLVEEIVDTDVDSREYDLSALLDGMVDAARAEYGDATIDLDVPDRCPVEASPKLDAAIENLIENAIEHGRHGNPHVRVSLTGGETTCLSVTDNGTGIPEQEVKVLEDGGESQLTHGSGLGLWFVKLVADRSNADLSFDSSAEGTDVMLRFE